MAVVSASGVIEAIGFVGTALGIIDFAAGYWEEDGPQGATVRIKGT